MHFQNTVKFVVISATTALLSSCSDGSLQESGGSAGDGPDNPEAVAIIQPFTGLYDLQDDWNGQAGDQAFLSIEAPADNGVSKATLFDIDDVDNCVARPMTGEVIVDPFTNQVFLNNILDLDESVLGLTNSGITIDLADDIDRDNDGNSSEIIQLTAERTALTDMDLGPDC